MLASSERPDNDLQTRTDREVAGTQAGVGEEALRSEQAGGSRTGTDPTPSTTTPSSRSRRGRPTLERNRPSGPSPLWQVRAPRSLDDALRARAAAEGRSFSEVLRDAAREYLSHPAK